MTIRCAGCGAVLAQIPRSKEYDPVIRQKILDKFGVVYTNCGDFVHDGECYDKVRRGWMVKA